LSDQGTVLVDIDRAGCLQKSADGRLRKGDQVGIEIESAHQADTAQQRRATEAVTGVGVLIADGPALHMVGVVEFEAGEASREPLRLIPGRVVAQQPVSVSKTRIEIDGGITATRADVERVVDEGAGHGSGRELLRTRIQIDALIAERTGGQGQRQPPSIGVQLNIAAVSIDAQVDKTASAYRLFLRVLQGQLRALECVLIHQDVLVANDNESTAVAASVNTQLQQHSVCLCHERTGCEQCEADQGELVPSHASAPVVRVWESEVFAMLGQDTDTEAARGQILVGNFMCRNHVLAGST